MTPHIMTKLKIPQYFTTQLGSIYKKIVVIQKWKMTKSAALVIRLNQNDELNDEITCILKHILNW